MKKYLFSIILSIVFLIPFTIQANTISAPSYQVGVAHSAIADIGSGSGDIVAAKAVQSTKTMLRTQNVANITLEPADLINKVSQHTPHKSIAANAILVSGGGYIGIRPVS